MRLGLFDLANQSAVPGGQAAAASGNAPSQDFVATPRCDSVFRSVYDISPSPTPIGGLMGLAPVNTGVGGTNWQANTVASQAYIRGLYGIVNAPAAQTGVGAMSKASVVVEGPAIALVAPSPTTTITPGTALVADGAGHLQLVATPTSAQILAIALATVSTGPATALQLCSVWVAKGA